MNAKFATKTASGNGNQTKNALTKKKGVTYAQVVVPEVERQPTALVEVVDAHPGAAAAKKAGNKAGQKKKEKMMKGAFWGEDIQYNKGKRVNSAGQFANRRGDITTKSSDGSYGIVADPKKTISTTMASIVRKNVDLDVLVIIAEKLRSDTPLTEMERERSLRNTSPDVEPLENVEAAAVSIQKVLVKLTDKLHKLFDKTMSGNSATCQNTFDKGVLVKHFRETTKVLDEDGGAVDHDHVKKLETLTTKLSEHYRVNGWVEDLEEMDFSLTPTWDD